MANQWDGQIVLAEAGLAPLGAIQAIYDTSGNVVGLSAGGNVLPGSSVIVHSNYVDINSIADTNEQILEQHTFPAGSLAVGDIIRLTCKLLKSAGVDTCTRKLRLGTAGTVADAVISTTVQPATTSRTWIDKREFIITGATTLRQISSGGVSVGWATVNIGVDSDVTIPNISNSLTLSITTQMTAGSETMAVKFTSIELIKIGGLI